MKVDLMGAERARTSESDPTSAQANFRALLEALDTSDANALGRLASVLKERAEAVHESPGETSSSVSASRGRTRKFSVSMPEELSSAVQERVGPGEFSRYVSEAVASRLEADLLTELVTLLDTEHGPVPDERLTEARAAWPDAE